MSLHRISALLPLLALILLLCAAGCVRNAPPASAPSGAKNSPLALASSTAEAAVFIGSQACADCHRREFTDHQASHHAITLRAADRASLGNLAPRPGLLPGGKAQLVQIGEGYRVRMPGGGGGRLQFALGSGKTGMTYVTTQDSDVFEMRASYFPHQGRWKTTPGQTKLPLTAPGVEHTGEEARACIQCHVTTLPPDSNVPEKRFFGVGCEACHGTGSAHIAAMQNGKAANIQMERIGTWDAKRINDLCGKCHRNAQVARIAPDASPDLSVTSRFQPYALMLSRCFKESKNTLSCNTCHTPHQNTSHDMSRYEAACLSCHGGKKREEKSQDTRYKIQEGQNSSLIPGVHPQGRTRPSSLTTCPVNPRTGCVGCHMPRKPMLGDIGMSATAPDHFIRVRRPALEAKWARETAKAAAAMSMPNP